MKVYPVYLKYKVTAGHGVSCNPLRIGENPQNYVAAFWQLFILIYILHDNL